jgi:hypothetical protein
MGMSNVVESHCLEWNEQCLNAGANDPNGYYMKSTRINKHTIASTSVETLQYIAWTMMVE